MSLSWDDLAAATLHRQFQRGQAGDPAAALADLGPIQSQTARSSFLGLAARQPGLTHAEISAAFERYAIVRGSTLRGTVHTATAAQHRILDSVTRLGQQPRWTRLFGDQTDILTIWRALEAFAAQEWRTQAELADELARWQARHGTPMSARDARLFESVAGRSMAYSFGGLIRRPLTGGWETQAKPGYRHAAEVLGSPPAEDAVRSAILLHLAAHGPASRHDLAWWSGLRLGEIDAGLEQLDLRWDEGPDGRRYADLPSRSRPQAEPRELVPGVRLLPEFDALLCGYDPKARDRFVSPAQHSALWNPANGLLLPPLLVDGRIGGYWRMTGTARNRPLQVRTFPGTRRLRRTELDEPIAAVQSVLAITIGQLDLDRG